MDRDTVVEYLDRTLNLAGFRDYGPQGLQVAGRARVQRVVGMVDAGLPCVDAALAHGADLLLVHHGILWGEARPLVGGFGRLVRRYLEADLNLYAAHLALDAHPELGNNARIARRLGLTVTSWWGDAKGRPIAVLAEPPAPLAPDELLAALAEVLGPPALVQRQGPAEIRRIGICSGGGAGYLAEAARLGCDAYITGETSHAQYHAALGEGIHVVYNGHYASETLGVRALGEHLAAELGLDFEFVDLPTGV